MSSFFEAFGHVPASDFFADNQPVGLDSDELAWLETPDPSFRQYALERTPLPFDSVPPEPAAYRRDPTFMLCQLHRLWVTLKTIRAHLPDLAGTILDLGAFPFALDIILREYVDFAGPLYATTNLAPPTAWQVELERRSIQLYPLQLDDDVRSRDEYERSLPQVLALPDASVDLILFTHVIEHLYRPLRILTEARRLLRPGGKILVTTDNAFMLDAFLHIGYQQEFVYEPVNGTAAMQFHFWRGHNRFYTPGDLQHLLYGAGLAPVETRFYDVLYNSFAPDYFLHAVSSFPHWKARLLSQLPAYRNEVMVVGARPRTGE